MDFLLTPNPGLVFWTSLTFLILVFLLKKFAWKPILHALKVREETIESSLQAAERAKAEVEDLIKVRQEMIYEAKKERDEILKETRELKEKILSEAKKSAQEEAEKIIESSRSQIIAEKNLAIKDLKNKLAELSIEIAGKILQSELKSDEKQKEIIDKYLDKVNFN